MRRGRGFPASLAVVAAFVASAAALEDDGAAIVVTVDGAPIVRRDVDAALRAARIDAVASPDRIVQAQAAVIERLVDEQLLRLAIDRAGISAAQADVDAALVNLLDQVTAQGQQFADFLARSGRDEAGLRRQVEFEVAVKKLVEPRVTQAALASFVEAHRREYDGTLVRVSHIVLRPDVGAAEEAVAASLVRGAGIRREILAGDVSFAAAAERYSAAPSRRRGGDIGYLPRRSVATEEFARQVFALSTGEVSQPFVTPFGVHIATVTAVEPGREPAGDLTERLRPQFIAKLIRDVVAEQRQTRQIEYAAGVPHFDPATPEGGPLPRRIVVGPSAAP